MVLVPNWSLVGGSRVSFDGSMCIFWELGLFEVGDGGHYFWEGRMGILLYFDASFLWFIGFGLDEDFLPDDLICLLDGTLGFGSGLVFVDTTFNCWIFSHLQSLVRMVVCRLFVLVLLAVEVRRSFLRMFGCCRFGQFDFGGGVGFEGHTWSEAGEDGRYFGRVLAWFGC